MWWLIMNFFRLPALNVFQMINFSFFFNLFIFLIGFSLERWN